ncbi:MAG TPA: peptidoglycan DD-metalloendopeptidase family protein [Candidatus Udaeobacter sp.]|nr:peptidoglycan DD-metalloendopeptidase family protein [Candidatus Udaeobacter sp.]
MRGALAALALTAVVGFAGAADVLATDPSPSPCPTQTAASGSRSACSSAAVDPNQAAYDQLKSRLGTDVANALDAEQKLSAVLDGYAVSEQALNDQITEEEGVIATLEDQIAQLDQQIADTQARIDVEKEQLAVMARAIDRQPASLWLLIARSGNLRDALIATSSMVVAGQRAHALQVKLEADLAQLQTERAARQADLDRENGTLDLLNANLNSLEDAINRQTDVSGQLSDLIGQIQDAQSQLTGQPPDVTSQLAQLLESQEQDLIQRSYETAWIQAQVGTGVAMVSGALPLGKQIAGLTLAWPMAHFTITQPFGPSAVTLEPPLGPYPHFHTGVDMAAPLGTPVMAAGDGIVVAVGHTSVGYGNYVIVAHGGGIDTLYGHLLQTMVNSGDRVVRGQLVGLEGSTGFSTGPHLHFELRVSNQVVDPLPYLPVPGTSWSG